MSATTPRSARQARARGNGVAPAQRRGAGAWRIGVDDRRRGASTKKVGARGRGGVVANKKVGASTEIWIAPTRTSTAPYQKHDASSWSAGSSEQRVLASS